MKYSAKAWRKLLLCAPLPAFAVAAVFLTAPAQAQNNGGQEGYIVQFSSGANAGQRAEAVRQAGGGVRFNFKAVSAAAVTVPNANALNALQRHPLVSAVIPDRPIFAIQGKGKGGSGGSGSAQVEPAGVVRVGSPTATSNGLGIGVAIVDSGIDLTHADLAPNPGYSAFGGSCQDDNGHGTHVAGIVAALNNNIDVVGVAPAATPYCVKVLNAAGSGSDSVVMAGLDWVIANHSSVSPPIKVVNMSLGREGTVDDNPAMRQLIQTLTSAGIAVVVAAGNDASKEISQMVPAGYPEVLAVASTTAKDGTNQCRGLAGAIKADTASFFTTDGAGVVISAPGADQENVNRACFISSVGILSLKPGGGTTRMSGTSMAAPHAAGMIARMLQAKPGSTVAAIRTAIQAAADRQGTAPLNSPTSGYSYDGAREGVLQDGTANLQ